MRIDPREITGVVLAGGRGSRMGGADKGLQAHAGAPLALHALRRLAAQVGQVAINANRNLAAYEALGAPVWPDTLPEAHDGPLAGFIASLQRCTTPYLATVPCDSPAFPIDLVPRLAAALYTDDAEIAMAATHEAGTLQPQPVFCLMKRGVLASLLRYTESGQSRIRHWASLQRSVTVPFDNAQAFFNANTLADLERLQAHEPG